MATSGSESVLLSSFGKFYSQVQTAALKATKNAAVLPTDLNFHRSMDVDLSKDIDAFSARVLNLTNRLIDLARSTEPSTSSKRELRLQFQDDIVDNFRFMLVDTVDQLLERTDICLDQYLGRTKPPAISIDPTALTAQSKAKARGKLDLSRKYPSNVQKPQLSFKRKVDNSNSALWYPHLSHKYNAQIPLGYVYSHDEPLAESSSTLLRYHPYQYEIKHISYPSRIFTALSPTTPKSFVDTPFHWVNSIEDFNVMLGELQKATEIAVDLEHHDYRTYAGFLCLMQISTRDEDWVIDTLVLRDELFELNQVFTDQKIVKVFHGADHDIIWLQQNFDLYIVNLFDTFHASKVLGLPRHGLANLLEMYCDFTADKQYQLADWRIRPLPEEMLQYARSDTHFLLFIYDNLRNALLDQAMSRSQSRSQSSKSRSASPSSQVSHSLINEVLSRSEETCLRLYEKEIYDVEGGTGSGGWETLAKKWNKFNLLQDGLHGRVFKAVHAWRDSIAREEDESTRYVLPNHYIFQLSERPPGDMAALVATFQSVPPIIRRRAKELLEVIRSAMQAPAEMVLEPGIASIQSTVMPPTEARSLGSDPPSSISTTGVFRKSTDRAAPSSTLFGSTLADRPASPGTEQSTSLRSYIATTSSLFGIPRRKSVLSSPFNRSNLNNVQFTQIVKRIHSALVVAPSIPQTIPLSHESPVPSETTPNSVDEAAPTVDTGDTMDGMQVEIPYVPSAERKPIPLVADTIVVVGRAKQKKRKRNKTSMEAVQEAAHHQSSPQDVQPEQDQNPDTPFDFSSVPNILDNSPDVEEAKPRKKKKQSKDVVFEYGNFPTPPKAHSEMKSGNLSYTFK